MNALPDVSADGTTVEGCGEGFAFVADGETLRGVAGVGDEKNFHTARRFKSDVGQQCRVRLRRCEPNRGGTNLAAWAREYQARLRRHGVEPSRVMAPSQTGQPPLLGVGADCGDRRRSSTAGRCGSSFGSLR